MPWPAAAPTIQPPQRNNAMSEETTPAEAAESATAQTRTIRLRIKISGTRDGEDWPNPGQNLEVSEAEAADLIAAGYATEAAEVETAVADTAGVETATPQGKASIKSQAAKAEAEAKEAEAKAAADAEAKEAAAKK
jgi:hypothetical protein